MEIFMPSLAQIGGGGLVHTLATVLVIVIVVGALLYIAQTVISIPPTVMRVIWIVIGVIVAVIAIRFLETLV